MTRAETRYQGKADLESRNPTYLLLTRSAKASISNPAVLTYIPIQTDLAPHVGASLEVMERDSKLMRGDGPTIFTSVRLGSGVEEVVELILSAWKGAGRPGKPGPVGDEP